MNWANLLTFLRMVLTPVFIVMLFSPSLVLKWLSLLVFTVAAVTDWYDGYAARKLNIDSLWGKFLDPLADKVLVLSAFYCFHYLGYFPLWMVIAMIIRDVIITGLRIYGVFTQSLMPTHFTAKLKTFLQFVALYIIFIVHLVKEGTLPMWLSPICDWMETSGFIFYAMFFITLYTLITGLYYLIANRVTIREMFSKE